jgi:hypothetical protein
VGSGVTALTNGNYVVPTPSWDGGRGAATWGSGGGGTVGTISAANSLVGSSAGDSVGGFGTHVVAALTNGNYVVYSDDWNNNTGAATWGNGGGGTVGPVSAANSLTGVGLFATLVALPDGNYIVAAPLSNSTAVTWVDGGTGTTLDGQNTIDAQNSVLAHGSPFGYAGPVPGTFIAAFYGGGVVVGVPDPDAFSYGLAPDQTIALTPGELERGLAAGTNVVLQASNDITVNSPITVTPSATAGNLTLDAGRSIVLNASITTGGGNLNLTANDSVADGVVDGERDPGSAAIPMAAGVTLNTGSGTLAVDLRHTTDKTNNGQGTATLLGLTAASTTLSAGTVLGVSLNGTTPGDGSAGTYTQTKVTGPIDLGGATLRVSSSIGFTPGQAFVIVQSTQPIEGTFAGLPEGGVVNAGSAVLTVSYLNDRVTLTVAFSLMPPVLASAPLSNPYSASVMPAGGTTPYDVTVASGSLPPGLTLDKDGTIHGTPTEAGYFPFTVQATDSSPSPGPYTVSVSYTLVVTPPGFSYDSSTKVLTIAGGAGSTFAYSQFSAVDAAGVLHTLYGFTLASGSSTPSLSLPDALLTRINASAAGSGNTAYLYTNDTYTGSDGQKHETEEEVVLGAGGAGQLYKVDAQGNGTLLMQLGGFTSEYTFAGHADGGVITGTAGVQNTYVSAGPYAYMNSGSAFYYVGGGQFVYATAAGAQDAAYHYDASVGNTLVFSGTAYSFLMGTANSQSYFNEAVGFGTNRGIATHAGALAIFYDSPGDDTFAGFSDHSQMTAGSAGAYTEFDYAGDFAAVYAYSFVGGHDTATNSDTLGLVHLTYGPNGNAGWNHPG